jgi:hypothetical protein
MSGNDEKAIREATRRGVTREGGRVWIEGVPRPCGSCSSLAALTAALQQRGEDVSYTYLMGASSRAFRFQFSWCASAPHAYVGFNTFEPALKAVGYGQTPLAGQFVFSDDGHRDATDEDRAETHAAVQAAIDAGQTVMFGSEEDALLVGYEPISDENPTGWLCRPGPIGGPPKPDEPYVQAVKGMPWGLCTLKRIGEPVPRREAARWAIQTAVANAGRGTVEGGDLKTGFAAWQKWIDELEPKRFEAVVAETRRQLTDMGRGNEDAVQGICLGNAWCYENLYFARVEAARYLREIASDMPEATRAHLADAANEYEAASKALVPEGECFTRIAPYPWALKDVGAEWTDAMRARQADLLREALQAERRAVAALHKALDAM